MKKSLILILFTFICFITFTSEVFADQCWECVHKKNGESGGIWYYWSYENPSINNSTLNCNSIVIDEKTCKEREGGGSGIDGEYGKNENDDFKDDYYKENELCYAIDITNKQTGVTKFRLFWGTSEDVVNYKRNNGLSLSSHSVKQLTKDACKGEYTKRDLTEMEDDPRYNGEGTVDGSLPNAGFGEEMSCSELLGPSLTKLVSILLDAFKIAAMILCTVQMMMALIPPITNKDSDALNKALKKCVTLAIIFVCALLIDTFIVVIGRLFGFDLSCFR